MLWGGSRSTKPCVFPCKVAAAGDERYLVCAAGAAGVVLCTNGSSYVFGKNACSCVRSSMRFFTLWLHDRIGMAAWMLRGVCCGEEAGARNLVFFRVKWLQPAMKGTSSVRRVRLGSFCARMVPPMCFARMLVHVCVVLCGSWSCGCRSHWNGCMNVAWAMLWGGSRSTKPCVFPCKVAAAGDERYLVCAAGAAGVVLCTNGSSYVFCKNACSCVRSSMRFFTLWLHDRIGMAAWMLHGLCCGEEAGARNLVFFRVKWLQSAMKGTSSVRRVRLGSFCARMVPPMCFARMLVHVCVVLCGSSLSGCMIAWVQRLHA